MKGMRTGLVLLMGAACLLVSARLTLRAQERRGEIGLAPREGQEAPKAGHELGPAAPSVQDALQRPFSFTFDKPTSLAEVCLHLRETLRAPVVLDLAALDRQELRPEDMVQLQLEGIRLKTGLKLLLDQVGLTFRVIPEDNLLILTDSHGSADPLRNLMSEIKSLHRDIHDLQDAVDEVKVSLGLDEEGSGELMRKPTIIEELPGEGGPADKFKIPPSGIPDRPRTRPGA